MVQLTYVEANGTYHNVEAPAGYNLMEAAVKNGVPGILAECGGAAACSTCRVYIDQDIQAKIGGASELEAEMIEFAEDAHPDARLSCQITVSEALEGVEIRIPEKQKS